MPKLKLINFFCFFLFACTGFSQVMNEGFNYLEKGDFAQAEIFFEKVLKDYPNNKTARLCYARAVGLNSKPSEAFFLLKKLLDDYPDDFEVKLNYAESMLWNKSFVEGKAYYEKLISIDSQSFPAVLGYANCLSNLKEYEKALFTVNQALEISKNNPNAIISRKYIRLGYADQLSKKDLLVDAIKLLDDNLVDNSEDSETLVNKANLLLIKKDYSEAKKIYIKLNKTQKDTIISLNGLSLANHLDSQEKKALRYATIAKLKSSKLSDQSLINQSIERYIQALIWNKKFKKAKVEIDDFKSKTNSNAQSIALQAMLNIYLSNFSDAINDYKRLLVKDSISFDGNLGIANAYFANNQTKDAYEAVNTTLTIFKGQKDAKGLLGKLNEKFTPSLEEKLSYSFDNNNNTAIASTTNLNYPLGLKTSLVARYGYRKTISNGGRLTANSNDFQLGINYELFTKLTLNVLAGFTTTNSFSNKYNQFLAQVALKAKPLKLQEIEAGYLREMQNFNAELMDKQIVNNHLYLNYSIGSNFNVGTFIQYFKTFQSDNNSRNLLFASLYYNLLAKPSAKAGINYQFLNYVEQKPMDYFSPSRFNALEVFLDIIRDDKAINTKGIYYHVVTATGMQFIEDNKSQSTYRLQGKLGYKFSSRFNAHLYGLKSNIASSTAAGFTYTEVGLGLRWMFGKSIKQERLLK